MPKSKKGTLKPTTKSASNSDKKPLIKRFKEWWAKRSLTQKILILTAIVLVIVLIVLGVFVLVKINMVGSKVDDDIAPISENIDTDLVEKLAKNDTLNDKVKNWAKNDIKKMSSSDVKNILLIGLDSVSGCTDSMILLSININTKKITMASLYRDSYTYIEPTEETACFGKLNWACSKGGIETLISTIENNYKVIIDDYALVNYQTFPKVIDTLGGVSVYVSEKEATFLNKTYEEWSISGKPQPKEYVAGTNQLNGDMALVFCRIRQLDSDINRTERQRRVITSTINSLKNASISQINNVINSVLPYVKTNLSTSDVLSMAGNAVSQGWLQYEIYQTPMPTEKNCSSGWAGDQWIWIVDYEGAAYELQTLLYGSSTIK